MNQETLLLLFDDRHPCWTPELVLLAGESAEGLDELAALQLLEKRKTHYQLSPQGAEAFRRLAGANFFEAEPGCPVEEPALWLLRNRLERRLDRAFRGRWGEKEFRPGALLPYVPGVGGEPLFTLAGDELKWAYLDRSDCRRLVQLTSSQEGEWRQRSFPNRKETLAREGITGDEALFDIDLLLLHRYDTALYQHLPRPEGDLAGLFQTDRFLFRLAPDGIPPKEEIGRDMARLHLFLASQRALFLPGLFDQDSDGFDDVTWWFWVSEREEAAQATADRLLPSAPHLVAPALPLELWTISLEALETQDPREDSHWDLFARIAHPLNR